MARMRTLKPEAATSESLAGVPRAARWTFALLWTHCDDEGRAVLNPRLIKAALYPLDDDVTTTVIDEEIAELERVGAVCIYEGVDGKTYLHVPSWSEHQHPNRKFESKLPPCPKDDHSPPAHTQRSDIAGTTHAPRTPVVVVEGRGDVEGEGGGAPTAPTALKRGTRIPGDWKPSDQARAWTLQRVDPAVAAHELEQFRDFWAAKSGKDATKVDWDATWRQWIRNSRTSRAGPPRTSTADDRVAAGLKLAAELRSDERKEIHA